VVRVRGMVHERNPRTEPGRNRAAVVDPPGRLAEHLDLVHLAGGIEDPSAPVAHADRLGHAHADHAEGALAERHRPVARGRQLQVDHHQPVHAFRRARSRGGRSVGLGHPCCRAAMLQHEGLALLVLPGVEAEHRGLVVAVLVLEDLLVHDPRAGAVGPEVHLVDFLVGDPDRVVMAVAVGIVGMAHARQGLAIGAGDRVPERPHQPRAEVVARQLLTRRLQRRLIVRQRDHLHGRHRLGLGRLCLLSECAGLDQHNGHQRHKAGTDGANCHGWTSQAERRVSDAAHQR